MLRATAIVRKPAVKAERVFDIVTLDHEDRQRRRAVLRAESGIEVMLDLDKATMLNEGDALRLDDGRLVAVRAAVQDLLEIRAENPLRLMRVAWHVGNRHTPAEITEDAIYIEDDHVLAEMVRGQGCSTAKVARAFRPEQGAYAGGHGHHEHAHHDHAHHDHAHHDHSHHDHGHDHHGHAHEHGDHGHAHHEHGADCGCGHDHHHHHGHSHDVLEVASPDGGHGGHHHEAHDHKHKHEHDHHHGHDHGHGVRRKHDH